MINSIIEYLKHMYNSYVPCPIDIYFSKLDDSMKFIIDRCESIEAKLDKEIEVLTNEVELYRGMIGAIAEAVPDMMWFKDTNGVYLYANKAIKSGLLLCSTPEGKTDIEMALKAKALYGDDNHTFGEKCLNSDKVVLETLVPQRFLESGKVKGKMLYLEVYKAPLFINNKLKGVVGVGRNMTPYVEAYRSDSCNLCDNKDIFKMYEFGE